MASELDWRRRWKPDLNACSWQPLEIDGDKYLIKTKFSANNYEILLTDLTSYWHENIEETALKKRIQKLNPSVEAPLLRILDHIKNSLDKKKDTSLSIAFKGHDKEEKAMLSVNSELGGMPFVWNFMCNAANKSMACDHVTVPLMAMVAELTRRQQELVTIIVSKDKEIDDYKSQGVRTSRKHIETTVFDETAFKNNMVMSKGFESAVKKLGLAAFNTDGQELYRQIMTKHAWVTRGATAGGDGSDSLDDDESLNAGVGPSLPSWANRVPASIVKGTSPVKTSPDKTPVRSPVKSPAKSPGSDGSRSTDSTPSKDTELLRRQALERRLEQEDAKKQEKPKKKKKIAF